VVAALLVVSLPVYARADEIVHVVAKGQTLGRIAKRYRTSIDALREANNLRRGQRIHPGLSLVIPEKEGARPGAVASRRLASDRGRGEKGDAHGRRGGLKAKFGDEKPEIAYGRPRRPGFVRLVRGSDRLDVQLLTRRGRLSPAGLAGLNNLLRHYGSGAKVAIDPRLASLIGTVSDHFGGRPIHVVSGYRPYSPTQHTKHSNHNVGRAMDFSVEGVPNTVVRDFCRTFRNAGVGYYPNSTFVHLDVRVGKAYWVDYSRPGEAPRYDTPNAHVEADEATRDVEPHAHPGEVAQPPGHRDPGSEETP
jgi:uncharacterized protein YcbK (DUF882 family)